MKRSSLGTGGGSAKDRQASRCLSDAGVEGKAPVLRAIQLKRFS
jgi:hypothetical protein